MLDHGRNQISLSDGRRLVFSLAGPRDGIPIVYCHDAIGTALETSVDLESITSELGIRHIAICRPGIGGSDPAPGRDLLSFAEDVRELADALSIDRFKIVGVSAGGPYALAIETRSSRSSTRSSSRSRCPAASCSSRPTRGTTSSAAGYGGSSPRSSARNSRRPVSRRRSGGQPSRRRR